MKRFIIEQSDEEFYTSTSGISLVGLGLNRFTTLVSSLVKSVPLAHGIPHADVLKAFCALLAQGKRTLPPSSNTGKMTSVEKLLV